MSDFHWYPGHMAKAKRAIAEDLKLIDVITEDKDIADSNRNLKPEQKKLF